MSQLITDKQIVLKLNKSWMPVGYASVAKSIVDLCAGINCFAVDIDYMVEDGEPDFDTPISMRPVPWEEWIELPVRKWDLVLRSPSVEVRVPTVLVAKNFNRMPMVSYRNKPNSKQVWHRDNGVDQYTGRRLNREDASVDHVLPVSRGGGNTWDNMVLTEKGINWKKGNKLNSEAGLKLIREPRKPSPIPLYSTIREAKHVDWKHFLVKK